MKNNVSIRCEDSAENAVFMKHTFADGTAYYELNIEDSYCGGQGFTGFFGRLKRAWYAFRAKPVYFSGVCIDDTARVKQFFEDCLALVNNTEV